MCPFISYLGPSWTERRERSTWTIGTDSHCIVGLFVLVHDWFWHHYLLFSLRPLVHKELPFPLYRVSLARLAPMVHLETEESL